MSTLSSIAAALRPLLGVVITQRCAACRQPLDAGQRVLCTQCRLDMPTTNYWKMEANRIALRVRTIRPEISQAAALLYFSEGNWRNMIHRLKYKGEWRNALLLGELLGEELAQSPLYKDVDLVIPIPLHPIRQLWRGYNQSYYIARGVSRKMGIECSTRGVRRVRHNVSQVKTRRNDRWSNVESLFAVSNAKMFEGRHILIVDDLFTTGATMLSCAEAILDAVPTATISIATLAVSMAEFGMDRGWRQSR